MIKTSEYFKLEAQEIEKRRHKFIKKSKEIYQKFIEPFLSQNETGKFIAIEPETKEYFIAETGRAALDLAENKFPEKVFFLVRVGFKAPYSIGGVRGTKRSG